MGSDCLIGQEFPFRGDENGLKLESGEGFTHCECTKWHWVVL